MTKNAIQDPNAITRIAGEAQVDRKTVQRYFRERAAGVEPTTRPGGRMRIEAAIDRMAKGKARR
jgi:hypothetical protein